MLVTGQACYPVWSHVSYTTTVCVYGPIIPNLDKLHGSSRHIQRGPRLTDCLVSADKSHSHPGFASSTPLCALSLRDNHSLGIPQHDHTQTWYRSKARETVEQVDWHGKQVTNLATASRPIQQLGTARDRKPSSSLIRSHYLSRLSPGVGTASCGALHASDERSR